MLRDKIKNEEYFENYLEEDNLRINKFQEKIDGNQVKEDRIFSVKRKINSLKFGVLSAKYSLGKEIKTNFYNDFVEYIKEFPLFWNSNSGYVQLLWNVSIGIMLEIRDNDFNILVKLIEKDNPKDYLIDFILNSRVDWNQKLSKFKFDNPYKNLEEVVMLAESDKQKAVERLKQYLDKEWYKGHSDSGWYDDHKETEVNVYSGYWCWESGALVKILDLDDTILKDQEYYPYDMVHWQD